MIDTDISLERVPEPYVYFTGDGLIPENELKRLNKELPDREIFTREIKQGSQHRKEYTMWRCEPGLHSVRTPVADRLPQPWSELVDDMLSDRFRTWVTEQTGVDVTRVRTTVGLYMFGDGDYTTIDTGKLEKALSFGLYLNEDWEREYGGAFQVFREKAQNAVPEREIVPIGGRCVTMTPTESTWHRIERVNTGGRLIRLLLMVEFWRD